MYSTQPTERTRKRMSPDDDAEEHSQGPPRRPASIVRNPRLAVMLRVVTLCSGIEAVIQGYEHLMVPHFHSAACEKDRHARRVLEHNFSPGQMFEDITSLQSNELPEHDMLWAGFPCQPFSRTGLNLGLEDAEGRGVIILHIVRLIQATMPRFVVLENVECWHLALIGSFSKQRCHSFAMFASGALATPSIGGYWTQSALESRNRDRVFGSFVSEVVHWSALWCGRLQEQPARPSIPCWGAVRHANLFCKRCRQNALGMLVRGLASLRNKGRGPFAETYIMEVDHSQSRQGSIMKGCSPCLTRTRAKTGGHWITMHGRRLGTQDMLRLQHMHPGRLRIPDEVPESEFNAMIGNSMSVNIVEMIIAMLTWEAPAVLQVNPIPDKWST